MAATSIPVVFIHGLWLHATSWSPWVDLFRANGYTPVAPAWPGDSATVDETRSASDRVAGYVVDAYARAIDGLGQKPIVVGHSLFRYGFGNAVSPEESDELYERWTIPSPGRPLFEAAVANFNPGSPAKIETKNADRGPLLLTAGGQDRTVPPTTVKATLKRYQGSGATTELQEFPDRGHTLALDSGWRDVADAVLAWLGKQELAPR